MQVSGGFEHTTQTVSNKAQSQKRKNSNIQTCKKSRNCFPSANSYSSLALLLYTFRLVDSSNNQNKENSDCVYVHMSADLKDTSAVG